MAERSGHARLPWSPSFSESRAPPRPLRDEWPGLRGPNYDGSAAAGAGSAPGRAPRSCAGGHGSARDIPASPYPADAR